MTWTFTQNKYGLVEADAGPSSQGFNETLRDSIGSRAPKGWPPGLSTYWVDRAIEGASSGLDGSILLSGNSD